MHTPTPKSSIYQWRGVNAQGNKVNGICITTDRQSVILMQAMQRIRVTHVQRPWFINSRPTTLTSEQTAKFTRLLATLLQAGLALAPALELMRSTVTELKLSVLIHRLIQEVQAGASLHTALTNSHMCDEWLIHIVKAAESSGQLDRLLAQQADHREQIQAQQSQIRTALAYPLFVLVIALCASAGLLHWVVPTFEDVFSSFNTELPWLTRQVLGMSRWVQSHGLATLVLLIFAALGMRTLYQRSPVLQKAFDRFTLRLPGCQSLIQRSQLARWCTTLHALTQAGVQMDQALSIVAPLCSNRTYQLACTDLIERMLRGQSLSNAMKHHPLCFDPLCIQMCALGEESGTLTTMLHKLATQYEQQMQHQVKRLGVLVEPAIMSVLGLLTGGLIAALYLPIFQMGQIL